MDDPIRAAGEAVDRRAWSDACAALIAADAVDPLPLEGLELLATSSFMVGDDDRSIESLKRAHQDARRVGARDRAVRHAFWLAMLLGARGETAQAGGWIRRGETMLQDAPESLGHGYLRLAAGQQLLQAGDVEGAASMLADAAAVADASGDVDLGTLARLGSGEVLIARAQRQRGLAILDEAMVAVTSGEVSPLVTGIVYCAVLESCQRLFDLHRAREWTEALGRWVDGQPQLVAFRGQCQVSRADLLTLTGDWPKAIGEARRAQDRPAGATPDPTLGAAHYQEAELHRLRGELRAAEEGYRQAHRHGRRPDPGLALLRLAQGRVQPALAAIDRAMAEAADPAAVPTLLEAKVEILLASGDVGTARAAADELADLAASIDAPLLGAMGAGADGAVRLAEGDARGALAVLRDACGTWLDLDAPYRAARVRLLIGIACREVGDGEAARMELEAARDTFERLGASPALGEAKQLIGRPGTMPGGLSVREVDVLRLIAAGRSNREIAEDLTISDKTVARHVSNILSKLGLRSRTAATAFAYEHDLVTAREGPAT